MRSPQSYKATVACGSGLSTLLLREVNFSLHAIPVRRGNVRRGVEVQPHNLCTSILYESERIALRLACFDPAQRQDTRAGVGEGGIFRIAFLESNKSPTARWQFQHN